MSQGGLADGAPCPICSLGGTLVVERGSEADLVDGRTIVVHGVPTFVCDRCGIELFDEATTRTLAAFYEHAAEHRARTFVVDFDDIGRRAAAG